LDIYNIDAGGSMNDLATAISSLAALFGLSDHQLVGWGVIALTVIVPLLMAWKLPMRRDVKATGSGIPVGYFDRGQTLPPSSDEGTFEEPEGTFEESRDHSTSDRHSSERVGVCAGSRATQKEIRRWRETNLRRLGLSRGWAVGVHAPQVRLFLRRAPKKMVQIIQARRATVLMNKWKAVDRVSVSPRRTPATSTTRPVITHRPGRNALSPRKPQKEHATLQA
jgi:hypothetical protein